MRRVFLTGGSGFIGSQLLRAFVERGDSVAALDRSGRIRSEGGLMHPSLAIPGDLLTPETYRKSLAGVDVVVHLAAATGRAPSDESWRTNARGTEVLLKECHDAGVPRFLFVSSIAVTFPDVSGYPYAQAKVRAEEVVRSSGLAYAVVRPTMVFGAGSPIQTALSKLARLPVIPIFGSGRTPVQPVLVDDVVKAILAVIDRDLFSGETFDVGGRTALPIEELLQAIRVAQTGRRGPVFHIPLSAMLPVLRTLEAAGLERVLPFTVGQLATFRFAGTASENALTAVGGDVAGVDRILLSPPTGPATGAPSEVLAEECRVLTRYLTGNAPTTYVLDQYIRAHHVSDKFLPTDLFDQRLVAFSLRHVLLARMADSFARLFAPSSLLRRKLVLLLAILEVAPPTWTVIDRPPSGSRMILAGSLAAKTALWLIGLVVATAILFPLRLVEGGRQIQ
jgi:NADH dehydrogenase